MATQKFQVGQTIVRTGGNRSGIVRGRQYKVSLVTNIGTPSEMVMLEGVPDTFARVRYFDAVEPAIPAAPPRKFKVGERVICVAPTKTIQAGVEYQVLDYVDATPIANYISLVGHEGFDFLESRFKPAEPDNQLRPDTFAEPVCAAPVEPITVPANPDPAPAELGLKPTNPKDAIGNRKLQLGLLPFAFQATTALALTDGKYKYGAHNWTIGGVRASIYIDAALRHLARYNAGQEVDPDSEVHNLGHAAACIAILVDAQARGVLNDDRPPSVSPAQLQAMQDAFNAATGRLIDGHVAAGRAPYHYSVLDDDGSGDAD